MPAATGQGSLWQKLARWLDVLFLLALVLTTVILDFSRLPSPTLKLLRLLLLLYLGTIFALTRLPLIFLTSLKELLLASHGRQRVWRIRRSVFLKTPFFALTALFIFYTFQPHSLHLSRSQESTPSASLVSEATPSASLTSEATPSATLTDLLLEASPSAEIKTQLAQRKSTLLKRTFRAQEEVVAFVGTHHLGSLKTTVIGPDGNQTEIDAQIEGEFLKIKPPRQLRPGKYLLKVTEGEEVVLEQDFTWGVLAINTHKSIYLPNETAKLAIAVLDGGGMMVCDASLTLKIKNKNEKIKNTEQNEKIETILSTGDGTIKVNPECLIHGFTLAPDYEAEYQVREAGIYEMELTAETANGTYTISDAFEVRESVPFDVERITATRIYPSAEYPVTFKIKANQDFKGILQESVPKDFVISPLPNPAAPPFKKITSDQEEQLIFWEADWKKDQTYELGYTFDAPDISPQFYLLGPLTIQLFDHSAVLFQEARQWQIAADLLAGDAKATYTDSTVASPNQIRARDYIRNNNLWQSEASTAQTSGATIKFVVDEASPTRNEHLVGIWEQSGSGTTLRILRWNGSAWSTEWTTTTANTTLGLYTRPFDIAYEKSSGEALVVYSTGAATTNELAYRIWNGGSWTDPANYDVAGTTALACGIEIESRPSSDRIAMIYTVNATTNSLNTAVWNGGSWESNPTTALEAGVMEPGTACQSKAYDIAWEESSGEILAAWGQGTTANVWESSACTGGPPCTWGSTTQTTAEEGTVLDLATQPGTDNIGISVLSNNGNDFGGGFWNGSSWSSAVGDVDAGAADPDVTLGQRSVGVGWLTSGAATRGVLIYADAAAVGVDYTLISSGVVSAAETQCGTTPPSGLDKQTRVVQNPADSSKFLVLIEDANSDLWAIRFTFDGTTVTCADTNGGVALNANLTSATSQPFDFAFDLPRLPVSPSGLIQFEANHQTVIATGGNTTDGVTTNIYLDSDAGGNTLTESFTPKVEVRDTGTSFSNTVTNTGDSVQYNAADPDEIRSACSVYDDLNDRLVMWGGYTGTSTKANTNDTWVLSLKEKQRSQWQKLETTGTRPQANRAHVCVYDSLNDQLIVYGGWNGSVYLTVAWALTLPSSGTPTWSQLSVSGTPPSSGQQLQACAVYDPGPSRMIVYGGYSGSDVDTDVVYQLTLPSPGTPTWSQLIGITAGTPSATGAGRDGQTCVYDTDSDRMVMYGGHINAEINEVWSLNLAAGSEVWSQISPTGDAGTRTLHFAAIQQNYSGTDDRMIIFGGYTNKNDVWELTLPEAGGSTWTEKTPTVGKPGGRSAGALPGIWDPLNSRTVFVGGYDPTYFYNEAVSFIPPSSGNYDYRVINPVHYLQDRDASIMAFDSANNRMVMFGGASRGLPSWPYHVAEAWTMNTSGTPVWKDAGADTAPLPRELSSMVYDPLNQRAVSCYGMEYNTVLADCWALSLPSSGRSSWTNLNPTGTVPTARWGATYIYDDLNDRMVTFGGKDQAQAKLQDTQFLSLPSGGAATSWQTVTVDGTPPSVRWGGVAVYDPDRDRMIVFGGTNDTTYYQDTYALTLPSSGNPTWGSALSCGTPPATRRGLVAVWQKDYSASDDRMIVFGGYNGTVHYNDVWQLAFPDAGGCTWTQLSPSGSLPWIRRSIAADYDSVNNRMIIHGGRNADQFFGDTWALSLGASPAWTNLNPQVMVPVSVAVTGLTQGTSYHWQSWVTGSLGDSTKLAYGGNSDTPPAGIDFTVGTLATITVSGTCYQYDQLSDCTDSGAEVIAVAVNGVLQAQTDGTVDGSWSISGVTQPAANATIVVFINGEATANERATAVTKYNSGGTGNIGGIVLYQRHLTIGSDQNTTVSNTDMDDYDYNAGADADDPDIIYDIDGNNDLTVDNLGNYTDEELLVLASNTYRPDSASSGNVTTHDLENAGVFNVDNNTPTVGGSWLNSGTFTKTAGQTTTFVSTSTGETINPGASNFANVTFNGSNGEWTAVTNTFTVDEALTVTAGNFITGAVTNAVTGATDVTGTLTISSLTGTKTFTGNVTINAGGTWSETAAEDVSFGGSIVNNATTWTASTGTHNFTGASKTLTGSTATVMPTVYLDSTCQLTSYSTLTISTSLSGGVTGVFTNSTGSVLNYGGSAIVLNYFYHSSDSTVNYNSSTDPQTIRAGIYGNLTITKSEQVGTLGGAIQVVSDLTIAAGTLDTDGATVTLSGSFINSGIFTADNSNIIIGGGGLSPSIAGFSTTGALSFTRTANTATLTGNVVAASLTMNGSGGTLDLGVSRSHTINGTVTLTAGTLDGGSSSLSLTGNWTKTTGSFDADASTITFSGADLSTQEISGDTTFNNFTASTLTNGDDRILQFTGGSATAVTGTWTITGFSGKVITLQSSDTSNWTITPTNAAVTYVDVYRSTRTGTTFCATFSAKDINCIDWTVSVGGSCVSNTAPNPPTALTQKKTDNTALAVGDWTNETSVKFTANASDTDNPDTLYLCVEKKPIASAFTGPEDGCSSPGISYVDTPVEVTVTIAGVTDTEYHWRARVKDEAEEYSAWVAYGSNPAGDGTTDGSPANRDYGIDTSDPTLGNIYDGTEVGVDTDFSTTSLSQLSANWANFDATVSGLDHYDYSIGTTQGGTDVTGDWVNIGVGTSAPATGLTLQTSQVYYYNVRAVDNAGNTQDPVISSDGQVITPSLSFSVSPSTLNFANLNSVNSYTTTADATITTSTNAYNGYVVRAFITDYPHSLVGDFTIPDFNGGSYAFPDGWLSSDRGFGYNSSDPSVQGSDKFGSSPCPGGGDPPCYAPFNHTGPGDIIADHTANVSGDPITGEPFTITCKVMADNTKEAANYVTTIVYTITAQY